MTKKRRPAVADLLLFYFLYVQGTTSRFRPSKYTYGMANGARMRPACYSMCTGSLFLIVQYAHTGASTFELLSMAQSIIQFT